MQLSGHLETCHLKHVRAKSNSDSESLRHGQKSVVKIAYYGGHSVAIIVRVNGLGMDSDPGVGHFYHKSFMQGHFKMKVLHF